MKTTFGGYEIDDQETLFSLHYSKTLLDWVYIIGYGLFGVICLGVVCFSFYEMLSKDFDFMYIVMILLFGFVAFIKLSYTIARLFEPTKEMIRIDKQKNRVRLKTSIVNSIEMNLSELNVLNYRLCKDVVEMDNHHKDRFWVEVELVTISQERIQILHINPGDLIYKGSVDTKNELLRMSKKMTKRLADALGIESRYAGMIDKDE